MPPSGRASASARSISISDKNAILRALAQREADATLAAVAKALRGEVDAPLDVRVRAVLRAMVHAFRGRQRARKAVVQAVLAQGMTAEMLGPVTSFIAQSSTGAHRGIAGLSTEQVFVLSRALMGVIRAAVLEEQPFFTSPAFEDELVRMVLAYLAAVPGQIISS